MECEWNEDDIWPNENIVLFQKFLAEMYLYYIRNVSLLILSSMKVIRYFVLISSESHCEFNHSVAIIVWVCWMVYNLVLEEDSCK